MVRWMCVAALAAGMVGVWAMGSSAAVEKMAPKAVVPNAEAPKADAAKPAALNFTMKDIDGKDVDLSTYAGKVVMIVNTASLCGNTPQYTGLEDMYQKYKDKGFVILAFPANNFGHQEPGTDGQIKDFCSGKTVVKKKDGTTTTYTITFPLFSKISVKGDDMAPLYKYLTQLDTKPKGKGDVSWNFEKFLIGKDGTVAGRFEPGTTPENPKLVSAVEDALKK